MRCSGTRVIGVFPSQLCGSWVHLGTLRAARHVQVEKEHLGHRVEAIIFPFCEEKSKSSVLV